MKCKILLISILFLCSAPMLLSDTEKFVIGSRGGMVGFFSNFFGVINHIMWCEKNNKTPVVWWGKRNIYYDSAFGENVWDYYFNPVSPSRYKKGDKIRVAYLAPDKTGIRCYTYSTFPYITKEYRDSIHTIIKKYISLKPHILEKITKFYTEYLINKKTIAIHVRGLRDGIQPLDINRVIQVANACEGDQVLVATDEEKNIKILQKSLNKKVIYYNAHRSADSNFLYLQPSSKLDVSKAQLGEEVIIEAYLLSLCNVFIHSASNVALAVLFFNPNLENIYLNPMQNTRAIDI